ncbi:phosphoenolpyruvate synthase [Staphylothermus hellenicus DSM 12710]|uniref:Phosphoenolpyruvate synthase n=2 Tax=Staphylothermus hellenicus TaxID=84599 RepID=D7DCA1_STAHD|nr:phosphoenolpyruvate synthase [Staphylothermus hellenicus DSM 12710]
MGCNYMSNIPKEKRFVVWLDEVTKDDVVLVGGKNANLGEMIRAGIPVPPGFAVTAYAYKYFIEKTGLKDKIYPLLNSIDVNDKKVLDETTAKIRQWIMDTPMPPEVEEEIRNYYRELAKKIGMEPEKLRVAVRSSATAEDMPEASFAGQQDTYLNVYGEDNVVYYVKRCWASLFTSRAVFYRVAQGIPHEKSLMSVTVQKMVNSRSAGVMFTLHPVTGDEKVVVIEGSWGLGESVVGGKVTPDEWVVDKQTLQIVDQKTHHKTLAIVFDPKKGKNVEIRWDENKQAWISEEGPVDIEMVKHFHPDKPALKEEEVKRLAELAMLIEKHYGRHMDIEWAVDYDMPFPSNVFIVQARPETVWSVRKEKEKAEKKAEVKGKNIVKLSEAKVLVRGLPASPGVGAGVAKVIFDPHSKEAQGFKEGEVLVTKMTDPDWVPLMKKAAAIVTDEGGMTSHAAIVSRELGIPAIVGTSNATQAIKSGTEVTVDGSRGVVYEGIVEDLVKPKEEVKAEAAGVGISPEQLLPLYPVTATKIYMNLGEPDAIEKYKDLPFDGIGLMRIEFIITDWVQYHPLYLIEQGRENLFIDKLAEGIAKVAQAIYPRPVVVRFSDFKTNEYRGLKGGEKYEPEERNPMIGWRGVSRYIHPKYEPAFRLEVRAIKKVREEMGLTNVWVMFPFVRTTWELERALKIMEEEGLKRGKDFKVWAMAEVPSIALLADKFAEYVDGFSIGSNDLTQLILGADRDNNVLAEMGYFDERDPAVLAGIKMIIEKAHSKGATVSICGQAPSVYPEIVEFLVEAGIDSISVNPDAVIATRRLVASIERKIMLKRLNKIMDKLNKLELGF